MWITESHHATCGVFLRAISLSKDPQQQTVYALTAGHSLLSNEQCKRLVKGDRDVKKSVWEETVGKIGTAFRLSVAPHGYPPFEICGTPPTTVISATMSQQMIHILNGMKSSSLMRQCLK